ncbi:Hypothetical predicted protein [Podarcis lilfordi]|uniref:Uncharacterized protein n=1 Tax=Podarcis lilfordi TaxID=74358 RepID=A0AA35LI65_9SAUR|nr:Hypothetical predicted protein [Podarcis lilfordi]
MNSHFRGTYKKGYLRETKGPGRKSYTNQERIPQETAPYTPPFGNSCSPAGVRCLTLLSFGPHQQGQEEGLAAQDLHTHCPGLYPGEGTVVPLDANGICSGAPFAS